jgi:pimeloyl-ACP methyl ester carboxylesterase
MAQHINGPLNWEQWGKRGRPMVFVHPNPFDHTCWLYQMAHLQTWFRCIGIDLPGYGHSPTASAGLTMPDVAQACWEAVDNVTDEPAVLVGLSVGSNVVLHMHAQQPDRTLAMIHTGCSYRTVKDFAFRRKAQYTEQGIAFRREHAFVGLSKAFGQSPLGEYFVNMLVERNQWADAPTIAEMFGALSEPDPDWLHTNVRCPMLIITGSEDNSHQASFALQDRVPGCELVTIQGAGHACNMEQPWEWDRHALAFLERLSLLQTEAPTAAAGLRGS